MKPFAAAALLVFGGCAHRAHVTGYDSNPAAQVIAATFERVEGEVLFDIQLELEGENRPRILVRARIPCRVGAIAPPSEFRLVYLTHYPATRSTFRVKEGFITVHRCDDALLELSGGWEVVGVISAALELPFQRPNSPIPVTHVELTHVLATKAAGSHLF